MIGAAKCESKYMFGLPFSAADKKDSSGQQIDGRRGQYGMYQK